MRGASGTNDVEYLNEQFLAYNGTTPDGYYSTPSKMTPGTPGPLLRLKTGTESATPSVNGIIARNLLRLSSLVNDNGYRTLARQTCDSFSVEVLQHPFLFVGLLDAIVGLDLGTRNVTGVLCTADISQTTSEQSALASRTDNPIVARDLVVRKVREEAGLAISTATTTASLVDTRPAHVADFVGNPSFWLKSRNEQLQELKTPEPARNYLLICEAGSCKTVDV